MGNVLFIQSLQKITRNLSQTVYRSIVQNFALASSEEAGRKLETVTRNGGGQQEKQRRGLESVKSTPEGTLAGRMVNIGLYLPTNPNICKGNFRNTRSPRSGGASTRNSTTKFRSKRKHSSIPIPGNGSTLRSGDKNEEMEIKRFRAKILKDFEKFLFPGENQFRSTKREILIIHFARRYKMLGGDSVKRKRRTNLSVVSRNTGRLNPL